MGGELARGSAMADQAHELVDWGFSVIPLRGGGKRPPAGFGWKEFQERRASHEEIDGWFTRWPDANLGLVTGRISGLVVVDADGPEGVAWMKRNLPRTAVYQKTGKGWHAFFRHPGQEVRNGARVAPEVDLRGDGGYVVVAPSVHPSGHVYSLEFIDGFNGWEELAPWEGVPGEQPGPGHTPRQQAGDRFEPIMGTVAEGGRNQALAQMCGRWFGLCLGSQEVLLVARGWNRDHCSPPLPEAEVEATVKSIGRLESDKSNGSYESYPSDEIVSSRIQSYPVVSPVRQNQRKFQGNLTAEIHGWVKNSTGSFTTTTLDQEFGLTLQSDKRRRSDALRSLLRKELIKRDRRVAGKYHILDSSVEWLDPTLAAPAAFPVVLPLGLSELVTIPPKAVVIVAGATNSGKTALLLNLLRMNFGSNHRLVYLMSEMGASEFTQRIAPLAPPEEWARQVRAAEKSTGFDGVIATNNPDGLTVIDYLEEVDGEYFKISSDIRNAYDALRRGVLIAALQKKSGSAYAMGGEATAHKARLYLSLDNLLHRPGCSVCNIKIVKAKLYPGRNPNGLERHVKIEAGHKLTPLSDWIYCNDKQREQYTAKYARMLDN